MAGKLYCNLGVWVGWRVILYCDMAFGCVVGWRNCIAGHQIVLQHGAMGCRVSVSQSRTKKSIFSADFSAKNRFSVVLEKIFGWKNRLQKNRQKIGKNRQFF